MVYFKYVLITILAVIFTWTIHEFAHWMTGELLGNTMIMTLNTCYPASGKYLEDWHATIISAAGPAITLLEAIIFYVILKRNQSNLLFPFLLTCLYMRALAGFMNIINLNDEGRISKALGIGVFTLPILVVAPLLFLVYDIVVTKNLKAKTVGLTAFLIMLFSSIIILSDQIFKIQLL
jgi:hypothetical protein